MTGLNYVVHILRQLYEEISPPPYFVGLVVTGLLMAAGLWWYLRQTSDRNGDR